MSPAASDTVEGHALVALIAPVMLSRGPFQRRTRAWKEGPWVFGVHADGKEKTASTSSVLFFLPVLHKSSLFHAVLLHGDRLSTFRAIVVDLHTLALAEGAGAALRKVSASSTRHDPESTSFPIRVVLRAKRVLEEVGKFHTPMAPRQPIMAMDFGVVASSRKGPSRTGHGHVCRRPSRPGKTAAAAARGQSTSRSNFFKKTPPCSGPRSTHLDNTPARSMRRRAPAHNALYFFRKRTQLPFGHRPRPLVDRERCMTFAKFHLPACATLMPTSLAFPFMLSDNLRRFQQRLGGDTTPVQAVSRPPVPTQRRPPSLPNFCPLHEWLRALSPPGLPPPPIQPPNHRFSFEASLLTIG